MRLTRLEMSGFKSFADKVSIEFEQGVFAIVGPNGCGKSNISDAVRWVLGEQRARMLRGQKMEEVIFQGSSKRRPINVAQVSLCFDNSDGTFPIGYQEVVITRRLSRNGNSDYLINQAPVRLRDIQDLLRGTGLGSDAGVVIEAGMIERLLSDRAEERRSLFEEAAGIGFYRDRKNSTERRLDRTGDDLQRLDDLISEVQTQVRSLARQRGKAERHGKFTEERFAIVMTLARHDLKGIESRIGGFEERRKAFAVELPAAHENVEQLEREREQAMQDRASAEARRAEVERQFAQVRIDAEKLEGDINVAGERLRSATDRKNRALEEKMQAEALVVQAERELDAARAEREAAQKARESVQMELNLRTASEGETREQLSSQRTRVRELEDALQETAEATRAMTGERDALEHELEELRAQESEVTQRIQDTVEQQRTAQEEFGARQRELETRTSAVEHLARELEIARHALGAAKEREAALRSELRSQEELLSQTSARKEALERLERDRVGVAPAVKRLLESSARFEEGQIIGPLSDFINASRDQAVALERLLSEWLQAVLVKDMDAVGSVRRWHSETSPGPVILLPLEPGPVGGNGAELPRGLSVRSPAAEWIDRLLSGARTLDDAGMAVAQSNGAVFLADNSSGSGPLARRAELEALAEDLGSGTLNAERLRDELQQAEAAHAESDQRVTSLLGDVERARTELGERQLEHDDASRRLKRIELDLRELEGTAKRLSARIESQSTRLGDVKRELTGRTEARLQFESDIAAQKSLLRELEEEQETARERRVHWQVEEAQVSAREEAAGERESRAQETLERTKRQIAELDQEVQQIDSGTSSLQDDRSLWTDTLAEQKTRERELDDARENAAEAVKKAEAKLELLEEHIAETRARQAELTEESHRLEIERVELDAERRSIVERLETEWHRPFAELLSVSEEVAGDPEALREEATRLAEQIEAIGPVNPLAMEEHREEVERLEFLTGQRDDLVEAKNALQQALREIAQTARELFVETFAAVRENFATVFATLFQGGECDLRMTDESDPLGCDIEIRAAPRGKRTQRIHLLSSGERTLVATSLLFAIYLTKPSPFCLLDEVDAPLDDSNVNRFVRLLDEFKADTQFIVITHNPRTMQVADAVYGVTMQEPGVSSIVGVRLGELQPA